MMIYRVTPPPPQKKKKKKNATHKNANNFYMFSSLKVK